MGHIFPIYPDFNLFMNNSLNYNDNFYYYKISNDLFLNSKSHYNTYTHIHFIFFSNLYSISYENKLGVCNYADVTLSSLKTIENCYMYMNNGPSFKWNLISLVCYNKKQFTINENLFE